MPKTKGKVVCRSCRKEIPYKNNTTNLYVQLERHHKEEYVKLCPSISSPINETCDNGPKPLSQVSNQYTSCTDSSISRYSLVERCKFHTIMQIYKILHKLAPMYLHNMFDYAITVTEHMNRNVHRLFVPQIHTN